MLTCITKLLDISSSSLCDRPPSGYDDHAGGLFDELLRLAARRNGLFAFESALHIFPMCNQCPNMTFQEWNAVGTWKFAYGGVVDQIWFFAEDIFGDQFGIADQSVVHFHSESGEIEVVAGTIEEWACRILTEFEELTGHPIARRWQLERGPIKTGRRLAGKKPFVLGGEYDLSNLYEADSVEVMRLRGHIFQQIRDVPDGTRLKLTVDR